MDDEKPRTRKKRTPSDDIEHRVKDPLSRAMIDWVLAEAERRTLSDTELARRAKVTQSAISEMKAGTRKMSHNNWIKIVKNAFGLELRAALRALADWMDKQAALPDVEGYEEGGHASFKRGGAAKQVEKRT